MVSSSPGASGATCSSMPAMVILPEQSTSVASSLTRSVMASCTWFGFGFGFGLGLGLGLGLGFGLAFALGLGLGLGLGLWLRYLPLDVRALVLAGAPDVR